MTADRFCELIRLKHLECKSDTKVEFSLSIGELAEIATEITQLKNERDLYKTDALNARIANAILAKQKQVRRLDERC